MEMVPQCMNKRPAAQRVRSRQTFHRLPPDGSALFASIQKALNHNSVERNLERPAGSIAEKKKQLLIPKHAPRLLSRSAGHEKKTLDVFFLKHRQHIGEAVQQTVVASQKHGAA